MSTQQDIYATGSENRLPMLNKDNYVPWFSRLLRYAKSKLNGKLIYNSIMHGPYVRRMIPEPGDPDREVPVAETFHEQTNEELTKKQVMQTEADDQAIQTILIGLLEDIYIVYAGQNVGNQNGYNAVHNVENHVVQNVVQNPASRAEGNGNGNNRNHVRCYNYRGMGHLAKNYIVKPKRRDAAYLQTQLLIAQKKEARIQLQAEEFDLMVVVGDLDEIEEVNANCILMANLQQASTSGTVRFGNDHVDAILGYGDLQCGNILITRVYFVKGLGHNLFSVGQFCDLDLEVAFRRNTCFVRNLEGVDLLKGNSTKNLYTINLHEIASTSPICLMAYATSTKSWLWHQRLSHLNFDTINNLAKNDLVTGLPKFKYHKEHLCPPYIGKLGAKGDIRFFIGYSANSCAYRVYNRRKKKIMETMNLTFGELLAMDFERRSSKPGLQSMTSG
ncbi:retrovirus-related pol polyprotein from transposon TNT 1-94 [Tanacetum coccineum]